MKTPATLLLVGSLVACGGQSSATAPAPIVTVQTSDDAGTWPLKSAFAVTSSTGPNNQGQALGIYVSTAPQVTCSALQAEFDTPGAPFTVYANSSTIGIGLESQDTLLFLGSYPISGSGQATATYGATTSTCAQGIDLVATGGTVTITALDSTSVKGSYSLSFPEADAGTTEGPFTGTFDIALCNLNSTGGGGPTKCVQPYGAER